jgi:hypothetical protein
MINEMLGAYQPNRLGPTHPQHEAAHEAPHSQWAQREFSASSPWLAKVLPHLRAGEANSAIE